MKFSQLRLIAYGPFTDTVLDFSSGTQQLNIVYGPNEAGKSSALRAIHGLLFGMPNILPDDHIHAYKKLRIGATVVNENGETLEFVRCKRKNRTILNPNSDQGAAFSDGVLAPFLGGVDGETFQRVYGIGHEELRRGGEQMRALKGLVGESLFAATIGGDRLVETLGKLESGADGLFAANKPKSRIKVAEKRYRELKQQKSDARLSANEWTKLQADYQLAQQHRDDIVSQTNDLQKRYGRLERVQRGLGVIGRRDQALGNLEDLKSVVVLPETYDAAKRLAIESDLKRARERFDKLEPLLNGPDRLSLKMDAITIPDGLLEFKDAITELQDQRAVHVKAQNDRTVLQRDVENAELRADQQLRELGLSVPLDQIEQYRLTPDQRVRINALANDEKSLRDRPGKIEQQIATYERELQRNLESYRKISEPCDVSLLQNAVDDVLPLGDLGAALDEARGLLAMEQERAETLCASLNLWFGNCDEALTVKVPSNELINRFSGQFESMQGELRLIEKEAKQLDRDLIKTLEAIAALENRGRLPTEQELEQLRATRDKLWNAIRESQTVTSDAAQQYENAVGEADNIADRLRRETERVTQLAQRLAEAESLKTQIQRNQQEREASTRKLSSLTAEWEKEWAAAGIDNPLQPDEMRDWLSQFLQLQNAVRSCQEKQQDVNRCEQRLGSACWRLREALAAFGTTTSETADWSLARLLDHARTAVATEASLVNQRVELRREQDRVAAAVDSLRGELEFARKDLQSWQKDWAMAMQQIGLEPSANAEQANIRMESIQLLFETVQEIERKQKRIHDIDSDSMKFVDATERLAKRFLPSDQGMSPTDLALLLKSRFDQATDDHRRLQQLESQLVAAERESKETHETVRSLQRELDRLLDLAGTEDTSTLAQIERESGEKRRWQQRLAELDEQLHDICGNIPLDEFIDEAKQWDQDELEIEIAEVEASLASLQSERDEAVKTLSGLQAKSEAVDGSDLFAELDQDSLGVISRMQRDALLYMQHKLAYHMLSRQIDAHRSENEDPLLDRASVLFARLTCGDFAGIKTDYDGEQPVIVGTRHAQDGVVDVAGMSDGTRDQLYLALRLAYVEKQLTTHEPMPLIVDDILVHFDDRRSKATLEVLAELSQHTQVIFFTHHIHLAELAESSLSKGSCVLHQLTGRPTLDVEESLPPGRLFA